MSRSVIRDRAYHRAEQLYLLAPFTVLAGSALIRLAGASVIVSAIAGFAAAVALVVAGVWMSIAADRKQNTIDRAQQTRFDENFYA